MAASLKTHRSKVSNFLLKYLSCSENKQRSLTRCSACLARVGSHSLAKPSAQSALKDEGQKIIIPDKINRSPTALLEALSSTVKHNANQPMYMGIDDPNLLCTSDRVKKNHMAALESGRKAAQLMISETPEYFTHLWDGEPLPEAWRSPLDGYRHEEPSEAALVERLQSRKINDAIDVYKACKSQNIALSQGVQEKLLELLTAFNCEQPDTTSDLEEYIFPSFENYSSNPVKTWKKGNIAEDVFYSLPERTAASYCLIIRGMAANFDKESAFSLYDEAKSMNLPIDVYTFNKLLGSVAADANNLDDITQTVQSLLQDMVAMEVTPNVETFNTILETCKRVSRWHGTKKYVLSVISEMKACGIEPELSTYTALLNVFYYPKDKSPNKTPALFETILDTVANKDFEVKSVIDMHFFPSAMKVISTFFPDPSLALKLHSGLTRGQNSKALGTRQHQFTYYKQLMLILAPLEHTDVVMDLYKSVVPYVFFPTSEVYLAILENINMHETTEHLPWIFTDLFWSSQFKDKRVTKEFVASMATKKHEPQLQKQLSDMASTMVEDWKEKTLPGERLYLDGAVIGDMISIHLDGEEPDRAWSALELYRTESSLQEADPSCNSLSRLTQHSIEAQDYEKTKELLELSLNLDGTEVPTLVENTLETFTLSEQEKNYLQGLAHDASLQNKEKSSSSGSDSD